MIISAHKIVLILDSRLELPQVDEVYTCLIHLFTTKTPGQVLSGVLLVPGGGKSIYMLNLLVY